MSDVTRLWVSSKLIRPEERIRQDLLEKMLQLGYPKGLLLVEKELKALPHIKGDVASRRLDIVCLAKGLHPDYPFYPLLLIECKAHQIDEKSMLQVVGYNRFVKSVFVGLASSQGFYLGRYTSSLGEYRFSLGLPPFAELYEEAWVCFTKT